jgi:sulfatase maturation enzyme AslB (radical SAM superfamily)
MYKHLYAVPTWHCNLNCPHCFAKDRDEFYDKDKFLYELNKFDGQITIFGGEATTHLDRLYEIIESNNINGISKINGISTNLLILNDRLIEIYKTFDGISTSWNSKRFNDKEYDIWMKNRKIISDNGISHTIMITLTKDLFNMNIDEFISLVDTWNIKGVKCIKFEHYVGEENDPSYYKSADQWLCNLYNKWQSNIELEIADRINNWCYDCTNIYTLYPDGSLKNSCPHGLQIYVPKECYECSMINRCRPCRLQKYCSYPKEFANMVRKE